MNDYDLKTKKIIQDIDSLVLECINEKNGNKKIEEIRIFLDNMDNKFKTVPMVQTKVQKIKNNLRIIVRNALKIGPVKLFFYESLLEIKQKIESSNSMDFLENYISHFKYIIKNVYFSDNYIQKQTMLINNVIGEKRTILNTNFPKISNQLFKKSKTSIYDRSLEPNIKLVLNTLQIIIFISESVNIFSSHIGCFYKYTSKLNSSDYQTNLEQIATIRIRIRIHIRTRINCINILSILSILYDIDSICILSIIFIYC